MMFVDKYGYDKFPEREAILFTKMNTGQKTKLLTGFPIEVDTQTDRGILQILRELPLATNCTSGKTLQEN